MADGRRVRAFIEDHTGNKHREALLAADVAVGDLIPAIISALSLPVTDSAGRPVTYDLTLDYRVLQPDETLSSAGVVDGRILKIVPMVIVGGPPGSSRSGGSGSEPPDTDLRTQLRAQHQLLVTLCERLDQIESKLDELINNSDPPASVRPAETSEIEIVRPIHFSILIEEDHELSFEVTGDINHRSRERIRTKLDPAVWRLPLSRLGTPKHGDQRSRSDKLSPEWRQEVRELGRRLYRDIFVGSQEMTKLFGAAQVIGKDNLIVNFIAPRAYIDFPFELLVDGDKALVTQLPLTRRVSGVTQRRQFFVMQDLIRHLSRNREPLRVLLISSASKEGSEEEILVLAELLNSAAAKRNLDIEIHMIKCEQCIPERIEEKLYDSEFHIIHFSGNCYFEEASGEGSGFELAVSKKTAPIRLNCRSLNLMMRGSQTVLFYLSSGSGAAIGNVELLRGNDYLGVMDALVMAGVPNLLGFRWPVSTDSGQRFAQCFYEVLFQTQSPARAVLAARQHAYVADGEDPTWSSPVLIMQQHG